MSTPSPTLSRRLIELACRAPSVHNTQPWLWRIVDDTAVELLADRRRQLPVADPDGRDLALSCGAAVHHVTVAARALGLTPHVTLLPDSSDPDLLARIALSAGQVTDAAKTALTNLERRGTDRRRFTSWPVPEARLAHLAQAASGWGAYAVPITDVTARYRTEVLLSRALVAQKSDPRFVEEQQRWTDRGPGDGVPAANAVPAPVSPPGTRPQRFAPEVEQSPASDLLESTDGVIAICTAGDDQIEWLRAGEALSAMWLRATHDGLSLVPLSQVIEVDETRTALHQEIFAGMARPQILVRVGWQEISRTPLIPSPRRPLDDVLLS
jgi:hypothetical protein